MLVVDPDDDLLAAVHIGNRVVDIGLLPLCAGDVSFGPAATASTSGGRSLGSPSLTAQFLLPPGNAVAVC